MVNATTMLAVIFKILNQFHWCIEMVFVLVVRFNPCYKFIHYSYWYKHTFFVFVDTFQHTLLRFAQIKASIWLCAWITTNGGSSTYLCSRPTDYPNTLIVLFHRSSYMDKVIVNISICIGFSQGTSPRVTCRDPQEI